MVLSAESLFANFSTVFKTHLVCQLRRIPTQANAISPFVGMPARDVLQQGNTRSEIWRSEPMERSNAQTYLLHR